MHNMRVRVQNHMSRAIKCMFTTHNACSITNGGASPLHPCTINLTRYSGTYNFLASGDGGCSLAEFSATAQNFVVRFSLDERTGSESQVHITKDIMKSGAFKITKYHDPTRCGCREKKVPKLRRNKS